MFFWSICWRSKNRRACIKHAADSRQAGKVTAPGLMGDLAFGRGYDVSEAKYSFEYFNLTTSNPGAMRKAFGERDLRVNFHCCCNGCC